MAHGDIAVGVSGSGRGAAFDGIEPCRFVGVGGYYGDFVGVVAGEVGVEEDEDVGDGGGEGKGGVEEGPGVWVGVDDDGEEGGGSVCGM